MGARSSEAGVHPRRGMASLAMRQIDDAFERLDEMDFRLRILRDPFQATTIAGQRLVQKEKTRNSAAEPAGARKASRLPDTRHTVTWLGERR